MSTEARPRAEGIEPSARHRRSGRGRRRARLAVRIGLATFVVVAAVGGWLVMRGLQAKRHLLAAASEVSQLQDRAKAGDVAEQQAALASLQADASAARSETSDPVWRAVGAIPWLGHNNRAIAVVASSVDELATQALPALVSASASVDLQRLAPHNGHLDLAALQRVAAPVTSADAAVQQVRDRVAGLSLAGLLPPVRSAVLQLRTGLESAARTTATAARAVTLVPPMLGADGPRTYAFLFLNNAELRASGGIPGSWAIVRADHGTIQIVNQGSASDVNKRIKGVAVPADVSAVYTGRAGSFFQDVTLTPNFAVTAALAKAMLEQAYGVRIDGVIATDPVALAGLLHATGPVALPLGQSLTAANAVPLLLSGIYRDVPDPAQQDFFFAVAAKSVFDALSSGQGDAHGTLASLAAAAGQGRLSVWSDRPDEERELSGTPLAGALPSVDAPGRPTIGVFLNDGTAAKLDYYLREKVTVSRTACATDRAGYDVQIELTSTVPDPKASPLPAYVLGDGGKGLAAGTMRTQVYVYAPTGGAVASATSRGKPTTLGAGVESGRAVGIVTVDLAPGQTVALDFAVDGAVLPKSSGLHDVVPDVRLTPLAAPALLRTAEAICRNR
ncbi:MAG: hypothetical protein QOG69_629 [Actinomycetota bacterium]|nr:hypothetical protein [Actinomycetota bacterium]